MRTLSMALSRLPARLMKLGWASPFLALLLAVGTLMAPGTASALALSRGIQDIPASYQDCLARAYAAFVAEGYNSTPSRGEGFVSGFKANHGGYINCTGLNASQMSVIVFVATEGT